LPNSSERRMFYLREESLISWKALGEQYFIACKNDLFLKGVEKNLSGGENLEEKIDNKFFLAGGSARWMFGMTENNAVKDINNWIQTACDMELLVKGMMGDRSKQAVNHLLSCDKNQRSFIVSEYVAREISERCEASFIVSAASISSLPQSCLGWMGLSSRLLHAASLKAKLLTFSLTTQFGTLEKWYIPRRVKFQNLSELRGIVLSNEEQDQQTKVFQKGEGRLKKTCRMEMIVITLKRFSLRK